MRKHVICALMTFWKFLSRKIIELFIHCTISIVYITRKMVPIVESELIPKSISK